MAVPSVTLAGVAAAQANATIASFTVADTAAHVLDGLATLANASHLASITLTSGGPLVATAAQFLGYRAVLDKLTTIFKVTGIGVAEATLAQADVHVASFTVADTAAHVLASLATLATQTHLTGISLTDATTLSVGAATFGSYKATLDKLAAGSSVTAQGLTVAQAALAQADTHCSGFTVADTAAHILAGLAPLLADSHLTALTISDHAALGLTLAQYTADQALLAKLAGGNFVTVSAGTVARAAALQADVHVSGFTVTDTGANLLAGLAALSADSKLTAMTLSGATTLAVTWDQFNANQATLDKLTNAKLTLAGLTAWQALVAMADSHVGSMTVVDTAAHIHDQLSSLALNTHLASLRVSDATGFTLVGSGEFTSYKAVADKLVAGEHFVATGLTAAQAASAQADTHCASFTVADTAAHVLTAITALNADTHLTSLTLTDGPLTLTLAQFTADAALVGKLAVGSMVKLAGVTAANATTLAGNSHVGQVGIIDTLANIGTNLDALEALAKAGKISGIAVSDAGHSLTLTAAQIAADHDALALLSGSYTINQAPAAGGFHINLVYNASMSGASAAFKAGLAAAVTYFEGLISTNETVTLQVGYGEVGGQAMGAGVLGEAGPTRGVTVTYDQFKAAFAAHATTAEQQSVLANMGADPTHGGHIYVASAEAKALGLMSASDTGVDGVMGFARDATGSLFDYDRSDGISAGHYDFLGVVEHELSHALGRYAWLKTAQAYYSVQDLTRYSANGVHQLNANGYGYFSIDGGRTVLDVYSTSSDAGDWASSAGNDANNAYSNPGVVNAFTHTDVVQMGVLGYALA